MRETAKNPDTWRRRDRSGLRRIAIIGVVALAAGGCSYDDGVFVPPPTDLPFDPVATANSIFSLRFAPDNAVVVQVHTISVALGLSSASANEVARSRERGQLDRLSLLRTFKPGSLERAVANRAALKAQGQNVPLFPINFLGKEFTFDASIDAYVEVSDGGPQNGVRFDLYVVDLASGLPALPLQPTGFVDLIDQSDAVSTRLEIRAFDTIGGSASPIANYFVDGAFSSNSTGISVSLLSEGFVFDQNGRFDFQLDELLESDDQAQVTRISSVHRMISDEGTDVRLEVEGDLSFDGSHADLFFKMDIDGAAGLTLVDLSVVNGAQNGEMQHNGRLEVVVGGTVTSPIFSAVGGPDFTPSELAALDEILFGIDDILLFASEAFMPLADLFAI